MRSPAPLITLPITFRTRLLLLWSRLLLLLLRPLLLLRSLLLLLLLWLALNGADGALLLRLGPLALSG